MNMHLWVDETSQVMAKHEALGMVAFGDNGMDHLSSSEHARGEDKAAYPPTFEGTYPRYEFAPLVRLALATGAWLAKGRRRLEGRRPDTSGKASPGAMKPAE